MSQHPREDGYHSIADVVPAMIAFLNPAGEIENANRNVLEYLGTTLENLKGWRASEAIHPDDLASVLAASERAAPRGADHTTSTIAYAALTASIAGSTGASCLSGIREVVSSAGTS